jgi:Uma2 family endonuclease
MSVAQRITEAEYQQIVLADHERNWELLDGELREKPGMTWDHDEVVTALSSMLYFQLDRQQYRVRVEGRVRRPGTIFRPDVSVVPTALGDEFRGRPGVLAIFSEPLPLVVEVWSRSTGDYDVDAKVPIYQRRGDLEIWRIHPYERTVTVWRRLEDGSYDEDVYREGILRPTALPGVMIDMAHLFAD